MHRHGVAAVLLLLAVLVAHASTDQKPDESCHIPGYVFKPGMRPSGASVTYLHEQQQASTAAAQAACTADPSCTMFTTDGWLIGTKVYFTAAGAAKPPDLANITTNRLFDNMELRWDTRPYCGECNEAPGCCGPSSNQGGSCCGTYVASVSALAGQLAVQQPLVPAPAIFSDCIGCVKATDTEHRCCLDQFSIEAVNAPCTGAGLTTIVASNVGYTKNVCGDYEASANSPKFCTPRCTVRVLGGTLNDNGVYAYEAGAASALKRDDRCETLTLQEVHASGNPGCCERCWQTCCRDLRRHKDWLAHYKPEPRFEVFGVGSRRDATLDIPASGKCPQNVSEAPTSGCCQQLAYLRNHMSLLHSTCTLECAQKCGFDTEDVPHDLQGLRCFQSPMLIGWAGFYPKWVKEALLVKQAPAPGCSAADTHMSCVTDLV